MTTNRRRPVATSIALGGRASPLQLSPVPRIALTREEAAASLGMSPSTFDRHVKPTVRAMSVCDTPAFAVAELQRWAEDNSGGRFHERPTVCTLRAHKCPRAARAAGGVAQREEP